MLLREIEPADAITRCSGLSNFCLPPSFKTYLLSFVVSGSGSSVADTQSPSEGGGIKFNKDENWTTKSLSPVAVHEIGHALGLSDSTVQNSVMKESYKSNSVLDKDDIGGIQAIYGMHS